MNSHNRSLNGKTALVTGAANGIGRGCAIELAKRGANLVLNDRPGSTALAEVVAEVRELGRSSEGIAADVFQPDSAQELVRQATGVFGGIDILVSNPAYSRRGAFLDYPVEEFQRTIEGTLCSGFYISQAVAQGMVARGRGGKIIFISSVQAEMPAALCFAYSAAKAGLNQMTRSLAVEMAEHRVNVNAIEPGWIDTEGERRTFSHEMVEAAGAELPWGRIGLPADIGKATAFLASDDADYVTGVILPVDGLFRFKDSCPDRVILPNNDDKEASRSEEDGE